MARAAKLFIGEHDFTSFAAVEGIAGRESLPNGCEERDALAQAGLPAPRLTETTMVRRIFTSRILPRPRTAMLIYEVTGNGFLHHMVRNMVGTLVEVGRGTLEPNSIIRILHARDRTMAGPTAPAQGLCLVRVEY
jgi:tRNA pseudouridine38-40 synthase